MAAGGACGAFRGNQLAMAAGSATLRYVAEHGLWRHAQSMGERLIAALCGLIDGTRNVGEVRGRGLMVGVEAVDRERPAAEGSAPPAAPEMARRIQQEALGHGLLLELGGRFDSVVRFLPPLIVQPADIDEIAARFSAAVAAAVVLGSDEWHRRMGFERVAAAILARPAEQRAVLASYSRGVNHALEGFAVLPFEFLGLGFRALPWRPEDSLCSLATQPPCAPGGTTLVL